MAIRANTVNLLDDEGQTLKFYLQNCRPFPWQYKYNFAPNNHFLNTLGSMLFLKLFGPKVFVLRLTSLLSFPVFCVYLFKFGELLNKSFMRWTLWLSMLGCHFLLEYFAYSRGYGMSISFLFLGLYHLIYFVQNPSSRQLNLALFGLSLALLANLNLIWSAVLALAILWPLLPFKKGVTKGDIIKLSFYSILVALMVIYGFMLKEKEQLYIGSSFGFFDGLDSFIPLATPLPAGIGYGYLCLIVPLAIFTSISIPKWLKGKTQHPSLLLSTFFVFNILAIHGMVWILNTKMPIERTVLHWIPLYLMCYIFSLEFSIKKLWLRVMLILPLALIPFRSLHFVGTKYASSYHWRKEYIPSKVFSFIKDFNQQKHPPILTTNLGSYKHTLDFESYRAKGAYPFVYHNDFPIDIADYVLTNQTQLQKYTSYYCILMQDSYSGTTLLKRNQLLNRTLCNTREVNTFKTAEAWKLLGSISEGDTVSSNKNYVLQLRLQLIAPNCFDGLLVLQGKSSKYYYQQSLGTLSYSFNESNQLFLQIPLQSFPFSSDLLDVYLWNLGEDQYQLTEATISLYQLY